MKLSSFVIQRIENWLNYQDLTAVFLKVYKIRQHVGFHRDMMVQYTPLNNLYPFNVFPFFVMHNSENL